MMFHYLIRNISDCDQRDISQAWVRLTAAPATARKHHFYFIFLREGWWEKYFYSIFYSGFYLKIEKNKNKKVSCATLRYSYSLKVNSSSYSLTILHCNLFSGPRDISPSLPALPNHFFSAHLFISAEPALRLFLIDGPLIELTSVWFSAGWFFFSPPPLLSAYRMSVSVSAGCWYVIWCWRWSPWEGENERKEEMRLDILLDSRQNSWDYYRGQRFLWGKTQMF